MGKTTHTIAAAPFTSIKEQLKGYVKGKGGGSKQRHKQQKKSQRDETTVTLKHLNELTQAFEHGARLLTLCLQTGAELLALQSRAAAGAAGQGPQCCPWSMELGTGQPVLTKILSQLSGGEGEGSFP